MLTFENGVFAPGADEILLKGYDQDVPIVFTIHVDEIEDAFPDISGTIEARKSPEVLAAIERAAHFVHSSKIEKRDDKLRIILTANDIEKSR